MDPSMSLVLVTGATGFIGAHIVDELLRRGIKVRGTTRSLPKSQQMLRDRPQYVDRLEFHVISDLTHPGVFDEVVQGVDGIIHVASPLTFEITDNERDMLLPAIEGAKAVLQAAKQHSTLKRVVLTSSIAATLDPARYADGTATFTSQDWCPITYEQAKASANGFAYLASKKYAELAAWDYIKNESPRFDLVTICPAMVFGPIVHPVSKSSELNMSTAMIWQVISGAESLPETTSTSWVDVRDVAVAHVEALLRPEARNQRYLLASSEKYSYQLAADILRKEFQWAKEGVSRGEEGAPVPEMASFEGEMGAKALGIQYRGFKECLSETSTQLRELFRAELSA
ncbi:hypothetical protein NLI96_g3939 [Meripilus lineatus]|uniref:NAD-dependent epimerase/dehydratase domain-containing protein n=1 Tax=Meripilus lineatus TaxID=2056292 RepID=A0AAD5VB95_9APHY|nr:hypothetical protein NLI96_g3939 [Physisporinus lineatus]